MNPQTMLRAAEGAAIQARKNNSSAIQPSDSPNGSEGGLYHGNDEPPHKSKNPFKGRKSKSFVAVALLILLLLLGAGALVAASPLNIIGMMMSNLTDVSDTQYYGNLVRYHKIVSSVSSGDIELNNNDFMDELETEGIDTDNITLEQINNDANYRKTLNNAGNIRAMGYYDSVANNYYAARSKGGDLRNKFKDFKVTDDLEEDTAVYRETMENMFDSNPGQTGTTWQELYDVEKTCTVPDGNGGTKTETCYETEMKDSQKNQGKSSTTTKGHGQITEESKSKARSYISQATSEHANKWLQTVPVSMPCYIFKAGNLLTVTLHGLEIYNAVKYTTGLSESLSKTMAGYGHLSAVHEVLNQLFIPDTGTIIEASAITNGSSEDVPMKTYTGAPIEDPSLLSMLSDAPLESNAGRDQSFERGTKSLLNTLSFNKYTYAICSGLEALSEAGGIAALGYTAMGAIGILLTGGVATSIASYIIAIGRTFAQYFAEGFFGSAVASALSFLVPILAVSIFSNLFDMMYSQPFGAELAKSFYVNGTRLSLNSGQSLSDKQAALEYIQVANNVLTQQAEVDRLNRSPFDPTSKNTFLGSIIYKTIPLLIPGNNLTNSITTIANTTSKSATQIANLTSPNIANAAGAYYGYVPTYSQTFGDDCTALDRIFDDGKNNGGSNPAVGDVFCAPVTSFDKEAIETFPVMALGTPSTNNSVIASNTTSDGNTPTVNTNTESNYYSVVADNLTADGKIIDGGNLSKYIKYCTQRQSPFGSLDANIVNELQGGSGLIGAAKGAIGILANPDYMGWATGSYCVNSPSNEKWDEMRNYQVYVADSRIIDFLNNNANVSNTNQQSAVAQYLNEVYYPTIPENETDAQFISRIAGITTDDAEYVLALVDYYHYLDEYDASFMIAMDGESTQMIIPTDTMVARVEAEQNHIIYDSETPDELESQISTLAAHYPIYADLRNRSFAIC